MRHDGRHTQGAAERFIKCRTESLTPQLREVLQKGAVSILSKKGSNVRCSMCGTDCPEAARFCVECGTALKSRCPDCGSENAPSSKFCAQCGTPLAARQPSGRQSGQSRGSAAGRNPQPPQPRLVEGPASIAQNPLEGERKMVTALFADIKGSTELMEDLDPEEARSIVDPALRLMIDAVHRYDGYIVQSTGDGIFALFGAPVGHEDHPQRALYAALRMQEELRRYAARLRAQGGVPIEARIGANTGEVVVRSIRTDEEHTEYTPIGHTTNLASRMQVVAPTGSIAVSEATRRLVEGYFQLKALGPTRVKGLSEPVNVYEVTGLGPLRTRLQRAAGRGLTKFVGREREIGETSRALDLAKGGHGQIVAAIGEPGVGKSRLFFEFKAIAPRGCLVLESFSVSHGKASAYLPVIELLNNYFEIQAGDDARRRREKVAGKVAILDQALGEYLPYLLWLLDLEEKPGALAQMDAHVRQWRILDAIKRILLRESINQPLLLIFEDLHWIDSATQALLDLLAEGIGNARVMMLVNYRPEYRHQWGNKTYYTQLRLDPLGRETADRMLSALLADNGELTALRRVIIDKTEGNPFFMEETVAALLDEGALVRNGTIKLTRPLEELKIPPTVQAILAARMDRLPGDEKELLQTLAVIGKEFPLGLIRAVTGKLADELEPMLRNLQLAEFIYEQPTLPDVEYVFKHALTQEVAYNSLLGERRRALHQRIGETIERLHADRIEDHISELAHHYDRGSNAAKAVEYLHRSGERAAQRSAYGQGVDQLEAALRHLAALPASATRDQEELAIRTVLSPLLWARYGNTSHEGTANISRARELCERVGDTPAVALVLADLQFSNWLAARLVQAREIAVQMLAMADRTGDPLASALAHAAMGVTCAWTGDYVKAGEHLESGLTAGENNQLFATGASALHCLAHLCWIRWMLGYPDQAMRWSKRMLNAVEPLGSMGKAYATQTEIALRSHFLREHLAARPMAEALIALARDNGLPFWVGVGHVVLGQVEAAGGQPAEGLNLVLDGISQMKAAGEDLTYRYFRCVLADTYLAAARPREGLAVIDEELRYAQTSGQAFNLAELFRLKGELLVLADASGGDEAEDFLRQALAIARRQEARSWELRAATSLARLLRKRGKADEARRVLAAVYGWFTEGLDTADLKDAKALLDELTS
jgi:class 3 adenylate cyclase/predicted ATPase